MTRKKKKIKQPKLCRGKIVDPALIKARYLRKSLLRRAKNQHHKDKTPSVQQLFKFFNHEHFICYYCFKPLLLEETTCDHKTSLSRGGSNELSNLCICCSSCNSIKAEFLESEFRSLKELVKDWNDGGKYLFTRLKRGSTIFGR